eukprot:4186247-Pleurochrysis_carterae.AAC.1
MGKLYLAYSLFLTAFFWRCFAITTVLGSIGLGLMKRQLLLEMLLLQQLLPLSACAAWPRGSIPQLSAKCCVHSTQMGVHHTRQDPTAMRMRARLLVMGADTNEEGEGEIFSKMDDADLELTGTAALGAASSQRDRSQGRSNEMQSSTPNRSAHSHASRQDGALLPRWLLSLMVFIHAFSNALITQAVTTALLASMGNDRVRTAQALGRLSSSAALLDILITPQLGRRARQNAFSFAALP